MISRCSWKSKVTPVLALIIYLPLFSMTQNIIEVWAMEEAKRLMSEQEEHTLAVKTSLNNNNLTHTQRRIVQGATSTQQLMNELSSSFTAHLGPEFINQCSQTLKLSEAQKRLRTKLLEKRLKKIK